jgi:hypothetical protein
MRAATFAKSGTQDRIAGSLGHAGIPAWGFLFVLRYLICIGTKHEHDTPRTNSRPYVPVIV